MNISIGALRALPKSFGLLVGLGLLAAFAPQPGHAQSLYGEAFAIPSESDNRRKANMAARQIMLIERMVELACFVHLDVEREAHHQQLDFAKSLYEATEEALKTGNPTLGLPRESNERLIAALADVDRRYAPFGEVLQAGLSSGFTAEIVADLEHHTGLIESALHKVLRLVEAVYLQSEVDLQTLSAFNFVTKERTDTQRLIKDMCLIAAQIEAEAKAVELAYEVEAFEARLVSMIKGEPLIGLPPAPTDGIRTTVKEAQEIWLEIRPLVEEELRTGKLDQASLLDVAEHATPLLAKMNKAVFLYESLN